jgi:molecular chaperone GrpE
LPFLDNLEKAEVFVKDQGLKMAKDHLLQTLKEAGIEESEVLNKPFDPMTSEAIEIVKGEKDDMVVQVLRKGYKFGDRILRVAQVKVSKKINN